MLKARRIFRSVPRTRRDDGMTMVLVALVLVLLMIFAAFAVDLGGLFNARRLDQNSADSAALAGAQDLNTDATVVATVKSYAKATDGVTFSDAQWNSCPPLSGEMSVGATNASCISFNNTRTKVEVRLPTQQYATAFAKVVGLGTFDHTAFAIAAFLGKGFGGVLPFGVPAGSTGLICPKTPPGGLSSSPCSGPTVGNFGYLNFGVWANSDCSGTGKTRLPSNIAMGVDHDLSRYNQKPYFATLVIDTTSCGTQPTPNGSSTSPGNVPNELAAGLVTGGPFADGFGGRLTRSDPGLFAGTGRPIGTVAGGTRANWGGYSLDDNGLWQFIPDSFGINTNVPAACHRDQFVGSGSGQGNMLSLPQAIQDRFNGAGYSIPVRMEKLLQRCFTEYQGLPWGDPGSNGVNQMTTPELSDCPVTGCTDPVFSVNSTTTDSPDLFDIQYTPRFGYVPELRPGDDPNGNSNVGFSRYRPIYVDQVCMGTGSGCPDYIPGFGQTGSAPNGVEGFLAYAFPDHMLPGRLGDVDAPFDLGVNKFVFLVR